MIYALINPNNQIHITHDFVDLEIPETKNGWRWIPIESDPRPIYNPNLQVATTEEVIEQDRVYRYWQVRDKTEQEISIDNSKKINSIQPIILTALLDLHNKINNSSISLEEYKNYLKGLI